MLRVRQRAIHRVEIRKTICMDMRQKLPAALCIPGPHLLFRRVPFGMATLSLAPLGLAPLGMPASVMLRPVCFAEHGPDCSCPNPDRKQARRAPPQPKSHFSRVCTHVSTCISTQAQAQARGEALQSETYVATEE